MSRPLQARICLSSLKNNLEMVRRAAPGSKILAVIKANAYGHGLLRTAAALRAAEGFAVLTLSEALELRRAGFKHPIVLLEGFFEPGELPAIAEHRLIPVIHSFDQLDMLDAAGLTRAIDVFLKANTGMNRLGFDVDGFGDALQRASRHRNIHSITLMTHFACADEAQGIASQWEVFQSLSGGLPYSRSLANSATVLRYPEAHGDWVRPGIMLYGASPFAGVAAHTLGLRPAMTLSSAIIAVQSVPKGGRVGYGGAFVAQRDMRVGIVACGYADGYPRHAPTGTPILVSGTRTQTLGRVSMDMLFADISDLPTADVGTPVTLWGEDLPVEEVAAAAGTISYELLCALAPRVPVLEQT
jgi:alanine racemase